MNEDCLADISGSDALSSIIASIALQEAALSHIVNANSELLTNAIKLTDAQTMGEVGKSANVADLLAVSGSIKDVAAVAVTIENQLKCKLCGVLAFMTEQDN
ncbi:hypothetical protein AGMMS49992_17640 [Clostridia bacterium]|nr:hypothetical protein AGMMS49992_17640 [Clostridia bacterium]